MGAIYWALTRKVVERTPPPRPSQDWRKVGKHHQISSSGSSTEDIIADRCSGMFKLCHLSLAPPPPPPPPPSPSTASTDISTFAKLGCSPFIISRARGSLAPPLLPAHRLSKLNGCHTQIRPGSHTSKQTLLLLLLLPPPLLLLLLPLLTTTIKRHGTQ